MTVSNPFQVGGSVSAEHSIYVSRKADLQIVSALHEGELCYVFNSRQMGKSSLLLNAKQTLQDEGYHCCFVDMSRIGSINITIEQWYGGIISELWRGFGLSNEVPLPVWWKQLGDLPAAHKLSIFIETVLLAQTTGNLIIFLDEVDSVLSLPFSAADFLAVIRACYNERANRQDYRRLRFALFGVALPSDLISDVSRSPFNIGQAIALEGFTESEALPLAVGLTEVPFEPLSVLNAILRWSGGQPFLTQKICNLAVGYRCPVKASTVDEWVDRLVADLMLDDWEHQDNPEHLRTVRDRLLLDDAYNTRNLSQYQQLLLAGGETLNVAELGDIDHLYLTGLIARSGRFVKPRTHLYRKIFNLSWVEEQLSNLRPFNHKLTQWLQSGQKDSQWLLLGSELAAARQWAEDKHLPESDYLFIAASQEKESRTFAELNNRLRAEIEHREQAELDLNKVLKQLELAKASAERANQHKSEFLARVSHEVRTPLNSVLGLSYLAQQHEYDQGSLDYLRKIHRSADYMLAVINDMVDIGKVERGELTLQKKTFLLDELLDELVDTVGLRAYQKSLTLDLDLPDELISPLVGDPVRLKQILLNLTTNAIKFTSLGSVTLSIQPLPMAPGKRLPIQFSVKDTGGGIGKEPVSGCVCHQEDGQLQPGLGLTLCCELVTLMGGHLQYTSAPGDGTQFGFVAEFEVANTRRPNRTCTGHVGVALNESNKGLHSALTLLGYTVESIDLKVARSDDFMRVDFLLVDIDTLTHQDQLLDILAKSPALKLIPLQPVGAPIPHWLSVLDIQQQLVQPATPLRIASVLNAENTSNIDPAGFSPGHYDSKIRVLVVEDNQIGQQIVRELLEQVGIEAVVVDNGKAALEVIQVEPFSLVLMDIEMPILDGIETTKTIRKLGRQAELGYLQSLPVIAMTAHALLDDRKKFLSVGMNDHIAKPIDPGLLFRLLNHWLPQTSSEIGLPPAQAEYCLPNLPDIDTKTAIKRCGNNVELYAQILRQFAVTYQDGVWFDGSDLVAFWNVCHALKGGAASLGINRVSLMAANLERQCRTGKVPDADALKALSVQLQTTCNLILSEVMVPKKRPAVSQDYLHELQTFLAVIDEDHAAALECLSKLDVGENVELLAISEAMDNFDVDKAVSLARILLEQSDK